MQDGVRKIMDDFRATGEVHHVHTELAFLRARCKRVNATGHGIIPVSLNGDLMEYVPFFEHTNLVLKLQSTTRLHDRHKLFFKVLKQLYPDETLSRDIDAFQGCYDEVSKCLTSSVYDEAEVRRMIQTEITKAIRKCNERGTAIRREQDRRGEQ